MDEAKDLRSSGFCEATDGPRPPSLAEAQDLLAAALEPPKETPDKGRFRWSGRPHRVIQLEMRVTLAMLDDQGKILDTDRTDTLVVNEAMIPEGFREHLAALDIKL